jgi:hypothetical protein
MCNYLHKVVLLGILILGFLGLFAQDPNNPLKFQNSNLKFKTTEGNKDPIVFTYSFQNTSNDTLVITEIKSGCSCTQSDWQMIPILPGEKNSIKINYTPEERTGEIEKGVSIAIKKYPPDLLGPAITQHVFFSGFISPKPQTLEEKYPIENGQVRLSKVYIDLDTVFMGQKVKTRVVVYNSGKTPIKIIKAETPPEIKLKYSSKIIKPGDSISIEINLSVDKMEGWGLVFSKFRIFTDEQNDNEKPFAIYAYRNENLSKMPNENAPIIRFDKYTVDFGTIVYGDSAMMVFSFRNEGNGQLIIRSWKPACGCTSGMPENTTLAPGEDSYGLVTFRSKNQSLGQVNKTIAVTTNDPKSPFIHLGITGKIIEAPILPTPQTEQK